MSFETVNVIVATSYIMGTAGLLVLNGYNELSKNESIWIRVFFNVMISIAFVSIALFVAHLIAGE